MTNLDANKEELDSSESSTLDEANVEETTSTDAVADSSVANQDVTEDSTLSIVRDVVNENKAPSEEASSAEGQEVEDQTDGKATKDDEQDDENYSDVPFSKHPRFQHLLRKTKRLEADATRYQNVQGFLDTNGISAEEAAEGLTIMALMKANPVEAWERLKPHVQQLVSLAGEVLPQDLADMVQSGQMTHEAAYEVSRSRAQVQSVRNHQSFMQQQEIRQRELTNAQALYSTAVDWEADRRRKDPNFEAKYIPLQKELAFLQMREGVPKTPDGVLDQLKRAYDSVQLPAARPAVAPARPRPVTQPTTNGQAPNAQPRPQTTLDIIRAARQR